MPTPPPRRPPEKGASRGNLFIEADPDPEPYSSRRAKLPAPARAARRRGQDPVVAMHPPSPVTSARGPGSATFTRANPRISAVRTIARKGIMPFAVSAARLIGQLAARPYAALTALVVLGGLLLAVGCLGFATRDALTARHVAQAHLAAAAAALGHQQARLDALTAQLDRAAPTAGRQRATALAATAGRIRAQAAERQLTQVGHRRHRRG